MPAVLVLGTGHLAYRVRALAAARGCTVLRLPVHDERADPEAGSTFERIMHALRDVEIDSVDAAFLVDDRDEHNLEQLLALVAHRPTLRIVASFYNESIAPHLQAAYANVRVLNPVRIAAPAFLDALVAPLDHKLRYVPTAPPPVSPRVVPDRLVPTLAGAFVTLILGATLFFHAAERLGWLDALYFSIVTVATLGYGDSAVGSWSPAGKLAVLLLILCSSFFIWMIFSLTVDGVVRRRALLALGRRRYADRGHVILCGLGRLGYFIADGLLRAGERVIIVERNEDVSAIELFRARGADVYVGDARLPRVLQDIGVMRARALYAVIDADYVNLEVGLNARSVAPDLRVVLRIFDQSMSQRLSEQLDIHLTFSMTAIAAEAFFTAADVCA